MEEKIKHKIKKLNETEREALAGMLMRSLRGSWRLAEGRIETLEYVISTVDVEDKERIENKCEMYYEAEHFDGRTFRGLPTYDRVIEGGFDQSTIETVMERVFTYIRHDMTWDVKQIKWIYESDSNE